MSATSRLEVILKLYIGGGGAPNGCGGAAGTLEARVVGPIGLVDVLQTLCGLSASSASAGTQIAAWQRVREAAGPGRFWLRSLEADGRVLLRWRSRRRPRGRR